MAVQISIYSNGNASSKTVTFDFQSSVLASSYDASAGGTSLDHYMIVKTSAKDTDGASLPNRVIVSLEDLALLGSTGNSHSMANTTAAYANVTAIVQDYLYDYIYGHTVDQYSTGVSEQKPMKFN